MNAIILSIGDELVLGQTVDTNSAWVSQQLAAVGCDIAGHATVPDDQKQIEDAIRLAISRCDVLLISGGIGPTEDDLTRQAIAVVMNVDLEMNPNWLAKLTEFFKSRNRVMPEINKIQAMIPRGAEMIDNTAGTAAGIHAVIGACNVFSMPGVPREMKAMFTLSALPYIRQQSGGAVILSRTLHTFGLGESAVAEKLGTLMKRGSNPSVGTTVANGIVSLRLNARFESISRATQQLEAVTAACQTALGDLIFGHDDQTLPHAIANLMRTATKSGLWPPRKAAPQVCWPRC